MKEQFWEALTTTKENSKGITIALGAFNARVGRKDNTTYSLIGKHGEDKHNNGRRLLDYCIQLDFVITNTFYMYKNIHKFTGEVQSRGERSIIEYDEWQKYIQTTICL